jgi:uncharacterized protein
MKKLELSVKGMTCHSCEILLEHKLGQVKGVEKVKVDHKKGRASVFASRDVGIDELKKAIKGENYSIDYFSNGNDASLKEKPDYSEIAAVFVILLGAYFFLNRFGLVPKFAISQGLTYGAVFLVGLIAAVSTCMAVTGGFLLGVTAKYNEMHPNFSGLQRFKPQIYFNIGRIVSYALLGGLVGALGSVLSFSSTANGILTVGVSILMVVLGLNMLKIHFFKFNLIPKSLVHKIYSQDESSKARPFFFGASTFFLPCGFTQALQLYVLSTGSFVVGSITMLVFSLGTLPALASVGALSSFSKGEVQKKFMIFAGALIVLIGMFNISNGLALSGIAFGSPDGSVNAQLVDGKQIVDMSIVGLEYSPAVFNIKKGIPVEWNIDGTKAVGCAQVITVPKLGITKFLSPNGITTIEFTPQDQGTIEFHCTMGMTTRGSHFNVIS